VDADGQVVNIPPPPGGVIDAAFDVVDGQAPGVSEATAGNQTIPTDAAIQPTPPASSAEVAAEAVPAAADTSAVGEQAQPPPPTAAVMPLSGPALSRRMGPGRSIGPAPKRTNVVQAPTVTATAPEASAQPVASPDPVPSQPAPPDLTEDAAPVDDGLGPQRQLVRQVAGELAHVNAILRNTVEHALKGEAPEVVPPMEPNPTSDAGIASRINIDWPGRTLATLGPAELQGLLERFEASLSKKRQIMAERGISE